MNEYYLPKYQVDTVETVQYPWWRHDWVVLNDPFGISSYEDAASPE